jgi:hypothetical protein
MYTAARNMALFSTLAIEKSTVELLICGSHLA